MKRGKIFIFAIIILGLLAALFVKYGTNKKSSPPPGISNSRTASSGLQDMLASMNIQSVTETKKAPEFELSSLEGKKISLSQFRGKAVILSFWSTW